ncbi:MAG TPA: peptidoglycan DD-metalloendopeptidase family protein [Pyrinomonadaceae bacterium]|nr:peptidoglycan DD-metalloendopeptidase family protein [Pyrinomonadaceae bacterium]
MALGATAKARIRVLLIAIVTLGALGLFLWARNRQSTVTPVTTINEVAPPASATPTPAISPTINPLVTSATPSPADIPQAEPGLSPSQTGGDAAPSTTFIGKLNLIIPVAGVKPEQLLDTFTDARSEGRSHDAIDIQAPAGTPVLAATEGEIVKLFQSERGGTTIYQLSPDKKLVFYYAHLQRYADGITAGKYVRQGEVIAYVGDTGNAGAGNYHLHFSIAALADPKRYSEGTNINPYPLLGK